MNFERFAVPKPPGRFRVFCLGGSTTVGYPYSPQQAWPRVLERSLRELFPERDIEVINVAGQSYGSGRVLSLLRGIVKYQPNLVVAALGDTEFTEDSFRVAVAAQPKDVAWLHGLYLSRMLKQLLPQPAVEIPVVAVEDVDPADFLFAPMPDNTRFYEVTPQGRQKIMKQFGDNLDAMVEVVAAAKIPLLLCTLPSNITSWEPTKDNNVPADKARYLRWQRLWDEAQRFAQTGDYPRALDRFATARLLWSDNADFSFDYGQTLLGAGQAAEALQWLSRARDLDPMPYRATSAALETVRRASSAEGVLLADLASEFIAMQQGGVLEEMLILDHAHPTPLGQLEIARIVTRVIATELPGWSLQASSMKQWYDAEYQALSHAEIKVDADLGMVLGDVLRQKGMLARAAEMYLGAIEQGNLGADIKDRLATVYDQQGRETEALAWGQRLVEEHPDYINAYQLLGYLYEKSGQVNEAVVWYQKAIAVGDKSKDLFTTLAALQLKQGNAAAARATYVQALDSYPGDCILSAHYGETYESEQNVTAAEAYYRDLLTRDPQCQKGWEHLGTMMMAQQRWGEARDIFQQALQQPSPASFHHLNLGYVYLKGFDNRQLAAEKFSDFLAVRPEKTSLVPAEFRAFLQGEGERR
jgi:tetratricopeptide (TPR) repeat protein